MSLLPTINFREFKVDHIIECLENCGYIIDKSEFEFAEESEAFKYIGFSNQYHRYLIGFKDEENTDPESEEDQYLVSVVLVWLDHEGKLVADYSGMPVCTGSLETVLTYIETRCN